MVTILLLIKQLICFYSEVFLLLMSAFISIIKAHLSNNSNNSFCPLVQYISYVPQLLNCLTQSQVGWLLFPWGKKVRQFDAGGDFHPFRPLLHLS